MSDRSFADPRKPFINIDAKDGIDFVQQALIKYQKQIPYAVSLAINHTANDIKAGLVEEMKRVFDRPTKYTLNSLMVDPSDKKDPNPKAVIRFKDSDSDGRSAEKYLKSEIFGGTRNVKGFEILFQKFGVPSGIEMIPASTVKLDASGNVNRATIQKILSGLEVGYGENNTGRYFISSGMGKTSHLEPGIWFAYGHTVKGKIDYTNKGKPFVRKNTIKGARVIPILLFKRQSQYPKRFDFFGVAQQIADKVMLQNAQKAVHKALSSARK